MTSAVLVSIADCMMTDYTAGYGAGKLVLPIVVQRGYVPEFLPGLQDYNVFEVYISPDKEEQTRESRRSISVEYSVEVGICCRLPDAENATVDPAMLLLQQMADYFFDYGLSNGVAQWEKNDVYFWPDRERLKLDGAFFALWDVTFKGSRSNA